MQKPIIPIDLESLLPQPAEFELASHPGKIFHLRKWTLKIKAWALAHYGEEKIATVFQRQDVVGMADIIFRFMLVDEDKLFFNNDLDTFMDSVVTTKDQYNIIKALVKTVGIGEPELKLIEESLKDPVNANAQVGPVKEGGDADPKPQRPNRETRRKK